MVAVGLERVCLTLPIFTYNAERSDSRFESLFLSQQNSWRQLKAPNRACFFENRLLMSFLHTRKAALSSAQHSQTLCLFLRQFAFHWPT